MKSYMATFCTLQLSQKRRSRTRKARFQCKISLANPRNFGLACGAEPCLTSRMMSPSPPAPVDPGAKCPSEPILEGAADPESSSGAGDAQPNRGPTPTPAGDAAGGGP